MLVGSAAALVALGAAPLATARLLGPPAKGAGLVSVTVLSASGGGKNVDVRDLGPITLEGGSQSFKTTIRLADAKGSAPLASWTVRSDKAGGPTVLISPPTTGLTTTASKTTTTAMSLPAGTYRVSGSTRNCTWSVSISEMRPTVTITSFTPTAGPVGMLVTLTGTGFTNTSRVTFAGPKDADFSVKSPTELVATVPEGAVTGPVSVYNRDGKRSGKSAASFTVVPKPVITGFGPGSGVAGTQVVLQGSGLGDATAVSFNGTAATITNNTSTTQITAAVPAAATTGRITVSTRGGTATTATDFIVLPTITGFTPTSGPEGTVVTVTGTGLGGITAVKFNSTAATLGSSTVTQFTTTVPAGAATGPISVTTRDGSATSADSFTVVPATTVTLSLAGLKGGKVRLGKSVTASGTIAPWGIPGQQARLTVQKKTTASWTQASATQLAVNASGQFRWQYKPTKKGTYRTQATVTATVTSLAGGSDWVQFVVK